ncbi:DinB family protein [Hymenobacter rubripertinctus]|uniref:DinB family protein n=1 Tax=Hymenobacter rubripertinctus TaxID=2029981 RepID=A0A418R299_9BACT|nr:DinB family protein [Hymenobacter rubripertinctus]RIY11552.1 DinB family protein [Hymenobacter rubripertinctus]
MESAADFLADLARRTQALQVTLATELRPQSEAVLNHRPAPGSWSALECLEHLNRYGRHYLPALRQALARPARPAHRLAPVRFSWLGRKSYELVRPENAQPHRTLPRMNPVSSLLSAAAVVAELENQLVELARLIRTAPASDLNRKAVPVEFLRLLKLRNGEALLFVVAHAQRHLAQATRAAGAGRAAVCLPA